MYSASSLLVLHTVNMAPRGMITVTTILLCFILGLLSPAPAACSHMGKACCTRYNRKPVPFQRIKGYREQTTTENCRIEAIIFYTVKKIEICATQKDEWVRKTLELLSSKLKKMSKADSVAGETKMRKSVTSSFTDGSGSFLHTTDTSPNSTQSFY
ncbi:C-C motif chemokine 21b isoform X2 [Micropterus salmoides]|uniref:C-C motif chemokine 21b isoform X2 n=1 Tax=Micropterus salmoides TaxID=27706 RepID=UPI0018EBE4CD|nr:C-C motif chemokine 21b isoform X2 [Micropterus salmoides]